MEKEKAPPGLKSPKRIIGLLPEMKESQGNREEMSSKIVQGTVKRRPFKPRLLQAWLPGFRSGASG
jgi:hypothetical protein